MGNFEENNFATRLGFGLAIFAFAWAWICLAIEQKAVGAEPAADVDFARDIQPILAQHCWACHGPDEHGRQGELRLDVRADAMAKKAVVPGDLSASLLVQRIESTDGEEVMPPPSTKKPLSLKQKELLKQWISQGAKFAKHWAFVTPEKPEVPARASGEWGANEVDAYVLQKLKEHGLKPTSEAEKGVLLRRLSLDLTGLPPTKEELDRFLADTSSGAYEKEVDRLLASPAYAERMAIDWLDAARYADTNGYNNDEDRTMWPWRDWVIDAFAKNMPYDQFIVEQLAGDLLPNPTLSQKVATAFHRNQGHNTEGGIIQEEYRVEYVADKVHTTATIFLGLSMQCARCHDHKFDPFTQKEYFQLFAFYNSVDEKQAGYSSFMAAEPFIKVPSAAQQAELAKLDQQKQQLEKQIAEHEMAAPAAMEKWLASHTAEEAKKLAGNGLVHRLALNETEGKKVEDENGTSFVGTIQGESRWVSGKFGGALALDGKGLVDCGEQAAFDSGDAFTISAWVKPSTVGEAIAILSKMDEGANFQGYDFLLESGKVACHLVSVWPSNGIKVITKKALVADQWQHVAVTYDGSKKGAGVKVYVNGKLEPTDITNDNLSGSILTKKPLHLGRRESSLPFKGELDDVQFYRGVLSAENAAELAEGKPVSLVTDLLTVAAESRSEEQKKRLGQLYLDKLDEEYQKFKSDLAANVKAKTDLEKTVPAVMVMQEMATPRETFVLKRGQYDQPGEPVKAAVPAALSAMPEGLPSNRLGLAKWLVDPANPLTARVAVNRWWQMLFGTGIVKTVDDFGTTGTVPTHPELLDYLATDLVASQWNVKRMMKQLVMSATYRQSSRATVEQREHDPENQWLGRGPRFRLPAEVVRDNALAISGLLVRDKVGGPSVKPYQPDGLWEDVTVERRGHYVADKGEGLYRRSMYTFWKRTCPPPGLMSFDAPNREVCLARRARTNTPLQSLVLLNDPTYVEASRKLAERMLKEGGKGPEEKVRLGFVLATAREPLPVEVQTLLRMQAEALARFEKNPEAAKHLLGVGESKRDEGLAEKDLAAWTTVASLLLNLDETISKR